MKLSAIYEFIAGNSRVTPLGLLAAVLVAVLLPRGEHAAWVPALYLGVLLATLAASVFEKV
ncbi:MAG: hypothetical protein M3160_08965 [Candidatus Eremiobacteraeota bacterium]|nr:hypothetical protein [Candidatus Eremiobacteraeota bacterium]